MMRRRRRRSRTIGSTLHRLRSHSNACTSHSQQPLSTTNMSHRDRNAHARKKKEKEKEKEDEGGKR